jgi:hypothetical protein
MTRECDCPRPLVDRCAHWGDLRIWLISPRGATEEFRRRGGNPGWPCPGCGRAYAADRWCVTPPGYLTEPVCSCTIPFGSHEKGVTSFSSDAEALAAFYEAEARLLAGELAS